MQSMISAGDNDDFSALVCKGMFSETALFSGDVRFLFPWNNSSRNSKQRVALCVDTGRLKKHLQASFWATADKIYARYHFKTFDCKWDFTFIYLYVQNKLAGGSSLCNDSNIPHSNIFWKMTGRLMLQPWTMCGTSSRYNCRLQSDCLWKFMHCISTVFLKYLWTIAFGLYSAHATAFSFQKALGDRIK